jgi:C4-type Zn-finger protein
MTTTDSPCESCGMPIESGRYCGYCTDAEGSLQPFEERFERMVSWQARREPDASREQLEAATLAYLATMPAWRDHPRVRAAAGS